MNHDRIADLESDLRSLKNAKSVLERQGKELEDKIRELEREQ